MENKQTIAPNSQQILKLKKLAHHLKPVVQIGKLGMSDNLVEEIDQNLTAHELIKIAFLPKQKEAIDELTVAICDATQATLITSIGNSVVIFRANSKDSILKDLGDK